MNRYQLPVGSQVRLRHQDERDYRRAAFAGTDFEGRYIFVWWGDASKNAIGIVHVVESNRLDVVQGKDDAIVVYHISSGRGLIPRNPEGLGEESRKRTKQRFEEYERMLEARG